MWQLVKWFPALLLVLPAVPPSLSLSIGLAAALAVVTVVVILAVTRSWVALDRARPTGIPRRETDAPPRPRFSDSRAPRGHRPRAPGVTR